MKACWLFAALALALPAAPAAAGENEAAAGEGKAGGRAHDNSGKKRRGEASYYGPRFEGRRMADGTRMDPDSNAAASKTLPLGTRARVKNLETGKSAEVEIRDRGPHVPGRIIDVTPKTAEKLDMKKDGVAPVEVTPLELPPKRSGN